MHHRIVALLSCFFLSISSSFAQSIVNVSPSTGTANATIPIHNVTNGQISIPVSLTYSTNGVKVKDVEGSAGFGWNLQAGGQISRTVNGLPDDCTEDNKSNSLLGWMNLSYDIAANDITNNFFVIQNDGDGTCSKETTDVSYINANFPYAQDTEPDIYYVNAPGLSCTMVYDRVTRAFHPVMYQDLIINYAYDPTSGLLISFTITNDKGIKYVFAAPESVTKTTVLGTHTYFANQYNQYQNGVTYNDAWNLVSITDANNNSILLNYNPAQPRSSTDRVSLHPPIDTAVSLQYYIKQTITPQVLQNISITNNNSALVGPIQQLAFTWQGLNGTVETGQTIISSITGFNRTYQFTYSGMVDTTRFGYMRFFLRSFTDVGCSTPSSYQFNYGGEDYNNGVGNNTDLPDSLSSQVDYWGYPIYNSNTSLFPKILINPSNSAYSRYAIYNSATAGGSYSYASTNGHDRSAELSRFNSGVLIKITYSQGATSTITYEPNTYIDAPSGQTVSGGGIRVKNIVDYDGINTANNITRNYAYVDSTGKTSGRPITLPSYAFTIPYSGTATGQALWDDATVISENDLSSDDHSIVYSYVTLSQTGAGSTRYHYSNPGTNWDRNVTPICSGCSTVAWNPTIDLSSRTNCSLTYGPVANDIYNYPFLPNLNFDFERGLPLSIVSYTDAGTKVSETDYTYQQYNSGSHLGKIAAFRQESNPNGSLLVKSYNIYNIYFNAGELTATAVQRVYDSPTLSQARTSRATYTYGSANHELLTSQSTTNSDGSTLTTNISYTKDFAVTASSTDTAINAIYNLKLLNINIPVESYQQVTRAGSTLTTSAALTLYKGFTVGSVTNYVPWQQFKMVTPDGGAFSPFTINTSTPITTKDSKYFAVSNYDAYDNTGSSITVDDANKNIATSLENQYTGMQVATFNNASYKEVIFDDFDSNFAPPVNTFSVSGTGFAANGSHAGNAYGLNTTQTVTSTTLSRNAIAKNYIFSIWINSASPTGTLSVSLTGLSGTYPITYSGSGWKYYEIKIPVGSLASSYTVSFTANTQISIDDILFYPDVATVATASYDPITFYKTSETNTNGVSAYYTSDVWGRLLFSYDQDKNITEKRGYFTSAEVATGMYGPGFAIPTGDTVRVAVPFTFTTTTTPCLTGVTYTWDFGDGTVVTSFNGSSMSHTYASTGTYNVKVTATHPVYGTQTYTLPVTVYLPDLVPTICDYGVIMWNNCTSSAATVVNCGSNTGDATHSYYTVLSVAGSGYGTLHYQWEQSTNNGTSWFDVGTNSTTYSVAHIGPHVTAYQVRCIVTSTAVQSPVPSQTMFLDLQTCSK